MQLKDLVNPDPWTGLAMTNHALARARLETGTRVITTYPRPGGRVVYCDTRIQPVEVRMGQSPYPENRELEATVLELGETLERIPSDDLPEERLRNVVLLGHLAARGWIPGVNPEGVLVCLARAVPPRSFAANEAVFRKAANLGAIGASSPR